MQLIKHFTNRGYKSNLNLKKANEIIEYTTEQILEIQRCSQDIVYFAENYCHIITLDRGLELIKLFPYQKLLLQNFIDNRFNVVLQARQTGKTTTASVFLAWVALFHEAQNIVILSNKEDSAKDVLSRIKIVYENLPKWMQHGVLKWDAKAIELENKSKIKASATTGNAAVGQAVNCLYIDEAAVISTRLWDTFYTTVYPTISSGTRSKIIMTSTARGMNHYYKIWMDAKSSRSKYVPFEVKWDAVPTRDLQWKLDTIANTSKEAFSQEHENEFAGSVKSLIKGECLRNQIILPPIQETDDGLRVYEEPIKNIDGNGNIISQGSYVMVVDTSEGVGQDNSAFTVFRVDTLPYKQVAVFTNSEIDPSGAYPELIVEIAKNYNDAWVLIETNSVGLTVVNNIHMELEYEYLFMSERKQSKGQNITAGFGKQSYFGVRTTAPVKKTGCKALQDLMHNGKLVIHDSDTVTEFSTFVNTGITYKAEEGSKDDIVMCHVLFGWLTSQMMFKELVEDAKRNILHKTNIEHVRNQLEPIGFFNTNSINNTTPETLTDSTVVDKENGLIWVKQFF